MDLSQKVGLSRFLYRSGRCWKFGGALVKFSCGVVVHLACCAAICIVIGLLSYSHWRFTVVRNPVGTNLISGTSWFVSTEFRFQGVQKGIG